MKLSIRYPAVIAITALLTFSCCLFDLFDDFNADDYEFTEPAVTGNTWYVDPVNGSIDGDGSSLNPWLTMQQILEDDLIQFYSHEESYNSNSDWVLNNPDAPVKGGDTIILRSGYHGHLDINAFMFEDWLVIKAADGAEPVFSQIKLTGAFCKIYFKNLTVLKESFTQNGGTSYWEADEITHNTSSGVYLGSNDFWGKGSDVKLYGLKVMTAEDITSWTAEDWVEKAAGGISLRSVSNIEINSCSIQNISMGITIEYFSENIYALNNTVKNFSGDGARIISNNVYFGYNTITDCFKVDDNHDDGIQSYSRGDDNTVGEGVIENVVIRGNIIIASTDSSNPLGGNPQGIGCFDGFFRNWVVENNLVVSSTYHGISLYGLIDGKIFNNTVVDQNPDDDPAPWIMVTDHKDGRSSRNYEVKNNLVSASVSCSGDFVTEAGNFIIGNDNYSDIDDIFTNPAEYDFSLLDSTYNQTNIIDKGINTDEYSSQYDIADNARRGNPDIGAYEFNY